MRLTAILETTFKWKRKGKLFSSYECNIDGYRFLRGCEREEPQMEAVGREEKRQG